MPKKRVKRESRYEKAAKVYIYSQVNYPPLTVSQAVKAFFTDEELKDKTLVKRVLRLSEQIKAQSPPVALAPTVPPAISPAKARSDLSDITDGSTGGMSATDGTPNETNKGFLYLL